MGVPRFWREIPQRYRLIGSRCKVCKSVYFPPRVVCPKCKEALYKKTPIMENLQLSGRGKVLTFTHVQVAAPAFQPQVPYTMAIVGLEEGTRITGQIIDCRNEDIKIGMKVQATFRKISTDGSAGVIYYGYKFRPAT